MDKVKDNYIEQNDFKCCYHCIYSNINHYEDGEMFCHIDDPDETIENNISSYTGLCNRFSNQYPK